MKKLKSIPVIYVILTILTSLYFISCKEDNPVTTPPDEPYQYDSARFNWKVDTLYGQGFYAGVWSPDTNEVFVPNIFENSYVHILNGIKTKIVYPEENRFGGIFGDENHIGYRVGAILIDTIYQPLFQTWNGSSFVDFPTPKNLDRNFFYWTAFVKNSVEIWVGLTDGNIVKFDGSKFIIYPLFDSRIKSLKFFYDESNKFKLLASIHHLDTDKNEFLIFQFENNKWVKIYNDLDRLRPLDYKIINSEVAAVNARTIFKLMDSALIPTVNVVPSFFQFPCAGYSFNNLVIASSDRVQGGYASLFHWNGSKWSLELKGYWVDPDTDIFMIDEDHFYAVSYDQNGRTYVMQGIKKPI